MFGWLKSKRQKDSEFFEGMMRAAAEGSRRAQINAALGSKGIQLGFQKDNDQYCIQATSAIVSLIASDAGLEARNLKVDDRFVAGLFVFVVSNHVSLLIGAPFEEVAFIAFVDCLGMEFAQEVDSVGSSYNKMSNEGRVIEAIGTTVVNWISRPTEENFSKLAKLFDVCRSHANNS